ncbi:hypothetical protein TOPH_08899 [Tolypocladium ophioglossoides CBS 100239]|uniref:Uncharacterized protein n=1 Tax=Tolypocladium ophioglossoides (strain CBS 100239) TaxID=1163406 RepID=A0A0L0MXI4_TOLOC|nr:hypothetical protein TOPH_08899 [Tolypocladium ophioglossoides CBS 100239]
MASAQLSLKQTREAILENGFFSLDDEAVGRNMDKMDEDGTPLASAGGLQFCKDNVLDNPRIRHILDFFFEWFGLGLYRSFSARPGDYVFQKNDREYPEVEGKCLLVHLLSKGSQVTLWEGSHRQPLPYVKGENNLWLVPRASLKRFGLSPTSHTFNQGGFIILDPRTAVEISQGGTATLAFGTKDVLNNWWRPMKIPRSKEIESIINNMEDSTFGMNVKYIDVMDDR